MAKEKPKATTNIRQKKLAKILVENRGRPLGQAMREAGYSEVYATNPKQLTETKSWKELLDKYLPDELLTARHSELLDSEDENIRLRSVQEGYKIKSKYEPEQVEHKITSIEVIKYGE
jgi:hypothetical protein